MKRISDKRRRQLALERELKVKLMERCHGRCEKCRKLPDFRGLDKHEIVRRSQGGDPLDPKNCLMLCRPCHNFETFGVKEVKADTRRR